MGNRIAIIIAIEKYQYSDIQDVKYAINDGKLISEALNNIGYDKDIQKKLFDSNATKTTIISSLNQLSKYFQDDDYFIFYFSGHGFAKDGQNYITCFDTQLEDIEYTSIPIQEIFDLMKKSKITRSIYFFDSCHSGLSIDANMRNIHHKFSEYEFNEFFINANYSVGFASCKSNELSYSDDEIKQGIWSYYIKEALQGNAKGAINNYKQITNMTLQNYLKIEVPKYLKSHREDYVLQTPIMFGSLTGEFIIAELEKYKTSRYDYIENNVNSITSSNKYHPIYRKPRLLLVKNKSKYPIKNFDFGVPLGLWVIKSYLRRFGFIADIFDERLEQIRGSELKFEDIIENYDFIGISTCTCEVRETIKKAKIAKENGKMTIVGGIFPFSNEEYLLSYDEIDYVIPGVATQPLLSLLNKHSESHNYSEKIANIFGVHCKNGSGYWGNGQKVWTPDTIPFFDRHIIDEIISIYGPFLEQKVDIITARGCSSRCDFCSIQKETSREPRTRNETNVIGDLFYLAKKGIRKISIKDENFPVGLDRSISILKKTYELLAEENYKIEYKIKSRIDLLLKYKDHLSTYAKLGVKEIQIGIETINPTTLNLMHKSLNISMNDIVRIFEYLNSLNITVNASFLLGIEGESLKDYDDLVNFITNKCSNLQLKTYINFYCPHPFKNMFSVNSYQQKLLNNDLECFTHKIPVVSPSTVSGKDGRRKMLECYDEIVNKTHSKKFNPPISSEHRERFINKDTVYLKNELPRYK
ncbi:MAG: caspase family protein [Bacteroidales bacterium]|nr:caspase family protein [Bacteroidales bacterium]